MRYTKADFKMLKGQTVRLQIVDYGEEVRAKIVSFGEDVRLKEKNFSADFRAIIC